MRESCPMYSGRITSKVESLGGTTRTWLDVGLYAAFTLSLLRALMAPAIGTSQLAPIVVLLPLCGLADKTILLAARVEHHFAMIVCFLFAGNWIAACKWVQLSIWFWAGVSARSGRPGHPGTGL